MPQANNVKIIKVKKKRLFNPNSILEKGSYSKTVSIDRANKLKENLELGTYNCKTFHLKKYNFRVDTENNCDYEFTVSSSYLYGTQERTKYYKRVGQFTERYFTYILNGILSTSTGEVSNVHKLIFLVCDYLDYPLKELKVYPLLIREDLIPSEYVKYLNRFQRPNVVIKEFLSNNWMESINE